MRTWFTAIATAVALALAGGGPAFAQASGTALGVDPDAEAQARSETRTLVVGSDIFIGDRVVTGESGLVQIQFVDNTRLVVGPRSALVIDDYLLRGDGSAGKFAVNALSGSFRFITGNAAKDRYVITTPTGTIGVRGTAFDFYVAALATYIMQLEGVSIECLEAQGSLTGDCGTLEAMCQFGILGGGTFEVIRHADELRGEEREKAKQWFHWIQSQHGLLREFRVPGAERCLRRPASFGNDDSISDPGTSTPTDTPPPPRGGNGGCSSTDNSCW
ncbi:MAG TPA: hypothetical protein GYA10_03370 [Alphaproteobacteria bacterium]|nr:hypothetical protein [Alphaproteobacteria bacterium]